MSDVRVLEGDALTVLKTLEPESVRCCVTSPPYWGLRDYGLEPQVWGGKTDCEHSWGEGLRIHKGGPHGDSSSLKGGSRAVVDAQASVKTIDAGAFCTDCGAWLGSLGLEPTPELYVEHISSVFAEVRRVLRSDGTLWLNLGDCYANSDKGGYQPCRVTAEDSLQKGNLASDFYGAPNRNWTGLPPKNLVGIPWRVAFALQAAGWWLRSDIIWHKPNPMPESVTDRPTKAHEYLFLLSKSGRYYYDHEAIKEPASYAGPNGAQHGPYGQGFTRRSNERSRFPSGWDSGRGDHRDKVGRYPKPTVAVVSAAAPGDPLSRNKRSVWTIKTQAYPGAHFATFPEALVVPCVLAGTELGDTVLDPFCGSGRVGVVCSKLNRDFLGIELSPEYAENSQYEISNAPIGLGLGGAA